MGIKDIIKKSFLEGYATSDIQISTIFICIACTAVIAAYIFVLYRMINKNSFYNRNFNLSLMGMAVLTAAIILTIQSNIVVSLGMVGALSIVRFRTAIKDPMDLVFLFWSISIGIICGAGFAMIAVIASIILTVILLLFAMLPDAKSSMILVINADSYEHEEKILNTVNTICQYAKIRSRNVTRDNLNLAIEVKVKEEKELIRQLMAVECVTLASLVEHDGNITI
ncbi:MAG: DUF4956 domain-containing protein [Lachnospiraceae bacterium]|nr:DUF4956 domain-containing protein [Lachnospiraceae bacterium]